MHPLIFLILLAVFVAGLVAVWRYRVILVRHWREPVMKYPVVIIESDDWGPGPAEQSDRLAEICALLSRYHDGAGHSPVMTIGVVLGAPDAAAIQQCGFTRYQCVTLQDPRYRELLAVLQDGVRQGVFALQLHGMEHLWPPVFMRLAQQDGEVRRWLEQGDCAETETLPPAVQSRWIDGSTLPSQPLDATDISVHLLPFVKGGWGGFRTGNSATNPPSPPFCKGGTERLSTDIEVAAREEIAVFKEIFGQLPPVAVPPTFIWNSEVEQTWAAAGVQFVITPGRRYTGRNAQGQPDGVDRQILNGEIGDGGVRYLVRDIYFEPTLGHQAKRVLAEIQQRWRLGRPALLETHRSNFLGEESVHQRSLQELERLLSRLLQEMPDVRFMSTEELGEAYRQSDSELFEQRLLKRVHVWLRRLAKIGPLRKLAWITNREAGRSGR